MELSFIALTWNSERFIAACIDSILDNVPRMHVPFEIFIVDNGSSDGTVPVLKRYAAHHPDIVRLLLLDRNHGTTASRNRALRMARGRTVVVLDSDVRILPGTIAGLVDTLESDDAIGLVAPRLVYPDGRHQKSVDRFPTIHRKIQRYFRLKAMEKSEEGTLKTNTPVEVDCAISAMWVFRKTILEKVGFLDERIFYAPEDVDYCLRIWKSGYRVVYDPKWTAVHDAREISRGFRINRAAVSHLLGLLYYFGKHGYCLKAPGRPLRMPAK